MPEAKAPYNFVELPHSPLLVDPPPARDRYRADRHSGWLDLEITAETPLYTRCAQGPTGAAEDFFHWGDPKQPVLPGSSLRGAIRNLVEILSYSRLSRRGEVREGNRVGDEALVYRGVADQQSSVGRAYNALFLGPNGDYPSQKVKAGYLGQDASGWFIEPAKEYGGRSFVRVSRDRVQALGMTQQQRTYYPVYVSANPEQKVTGRGHVTFRYTQSNTLEKQPSGDLVEGTLVHPGDMKQKRLPVIYRRDPQAKRIPISEEMWDQYERDRDLQRGIKNRPLGKPGDPLFYLVDKDQRLIFFGPNMFFRLPYELSPEKLLPPEESEGLDLAECLFGVVGKTPKGERLLHRGRVSFGDAPAQSWTLLPPKSPEILSSPKPTSYPYYVEQPRGSQTGKQQLRSYTDAGHRLRGFKRYWHRGAAELIDPRAETQYTTIRPVERGARFVGTVYFENLSDLELGALLTALQLPASCRHHLGMGKPRGLGSARLEVRDISIFDPKQRYSHLEAEGVAGDSNALCTRAKQVFAERILGHTGLKGTDLWTIPRLQELRCLLEWDNKPERERTTYLELKQFRDKQPLGRPSEVVRSRLTSTSATPAPPRPSEPVAPKKRKSETCEIRQVDDKKNEITIARPNGKLQVRRLAQKLDPKEIKGMRGHRFEVEWEGESAVTIRLTGDRVVALE
jgi:CRISPR-associated protein (TIGR03986 family)